ncbi:DUF4314 domain-containing protein [Nonomuraea polychroma]|uniref:DUF4314 domain-containing protein n=1 Tax=Nonomuraea polychroma TaxID=46176 RepID=UPI003D925BE1
MDVRPGQRVELVGCNDPFTRLKPGDHGTVRGIGPDGGIDMVWDDGSTLRMLPDQGDMIRPL